MGHLKKERTVADGTRCVDAFIQNQQHSKAVVLQQERQWEEKSDLQMEHLLITGKWKRKLIS